MIKMSLERLFTREFENAIRRTLREIKTRHETLAEVRLKEDIKVIEDKLLTSFQPFPKDVVFDEDFLVGAIDGSGVSPLLRYDDVMIHLVTAYLSVHTTGTKIKAPMKKIEVEGYSPIPNGGRLIETFWFSMDEGQMWNHLEKFINRTYMVEDLNTLLYPYFRDISGRKVENIADVIELLGPKYRNITGIKDLVILPPATSVRVIHDIIREITELSLAKRVLKSNLPIKYLLLDTTMTLLIPKGVIHPNLITDYMLRDVVYEARKKGVIVVAIAKSHTIPCTSAIAKLAEAKFGKNAHWFCRLPGEEDLEGKLKILEGRRYIPPRGAVTYIFRFSSTMPVFRLDLDRKWWEKNIYSDNLDEMKENEIILFKELDFMSHDARWYGYPLPLSYAHDGCTIKDVEGMLLAEQAISIAKEEGFEEEKLITPRKLIGI